MARGVAAWDRRSEPIQHELAVPHVSPRPLRPALVGVIARRSRLRRLHAIEHRHRPLGSSKLPRVHFIRILITALAELVDPRFIYGINPPLVQGSQKDDVVPQAGQPS